MKKPSIFKSLFVNTIIILLLVVVGFVATIYGSTIKYHVLTLVANPKMAKVLGAKIIKGSAPDANQKAAEVGQSIQTEVSQQVDTVKEKTLNTKVSDVIDFGAKLKKIANDIANIKSSIIEKVQELAKRKDTS